MIGMQVLAGFGQQCWTWWHPTPTCVRRTWPAYLPCKSSVGSDANTIWLLSLQTSQTPLQTQQANFKLFLFCDYTAFFFILHLAASLVFHCCSFKGHLATCDWPPKCWTFVTSNIMEACRLTSSFSWLRVWANNLRTRYTDPWSCSMYHSMQTPKQALRQLSEMGN